MNLKISRRTVLQGTVAAVAFTFAVPGFGEGFTPSADMPFEKKFVELNGAQMAYVDEGDGPVILFLHGNPTHRPTFGATSSRLSWTAFRR